MGYFMGGLALGTLGIILFQLSAMDSLYPDDSEHEVRWTYLVLRTTAYLLMATAVVTFIIGLF
ncbi:MAG TPA: hypothetical protein VK859_04830 [bacterium]|jgi:hypothetical protein|nr:hypothetical protein [bacterium]